MNRSLANYIDLINLQIAELQNSWDAANSQLLAIESNEALSLDDLKLQADPIHARMDRIEAEQDQLEQLRSHLVDGYFMTGKSLQTFGDVDEMSDFIKY